MKPLSSRSRIGGSVAPADRGIGRVTGKTPGGWSRVTDWIRMAGGHPVPVRLVSPASGWVGMPAAYQVQACHRLVGSYFQKTKPLVETVS